MKSILLPKIELLITFILLELSLAFCPTIAQKMRDEETEVMYIRLPYHRLPEAVKTYKPVTDAIPSKYGTNWDDPSMLNAYVWLDSYKQVTENPDLEIVLKIAGLTAYASTSKYDGKITDKEGRVIRTYTVYYKSISLNFPAVEMTLKTKNKIIIQRKYGVVSTYSSFGSTSESGYRTPESLESAWAPSEQSYLRDIETRYYINALAQIKNELREYYLMRAVQVAEFAYIADGKGIDYDYTEVNRAKDLAMEAIQTYKTDRVAPVDKLVQPDYEVRRTKMKEAIDIWEKALKEYDPEAKKAGINEKVARELYFNLSKAYLWIDDFAKAEEYYQIRKNEFSKMVDAGSGLNKYAKFLDDHKRRYLQNSWRDVYINEGEVVESMVKKKSRESTEKSVIDEKGEVDKNNPAIIYIYMPSKLILGKPINKKTYGILFNDRMIHKMDGGDKMIYTMYSEGYLKIESHELAIDEASTKGRSGLLGKTKKQEFDIEIRKGGKYYIKLAALNGGLNPQTQAEGEKDFKEMTSAPKKFEEDVKDPIPNLNIAMELERK
jgi:hypothetical protein